MTERECSICGSLFLYEEGEPAFDPCMSCADILDRESFLTEFEYGSSDLPEEF